MQMKTEFYSIRNRLSGMHLRFDGDSMTVDINVMLTFDDVVAARVYFSDGNYDARDYYICHWIMCEV
jgi:hypothetical protein